MKKFLTWLAGGFFLLGVLLAVENIANSVLALIFFSEYTGSLFTPMFMIFGVGIFAGFFGGLAMSIPSKKQQTVDELEDNI